MGDGECKDAATIHHGLLLLLFFLLLLLFIFFGEHGRFRDSPFEKDSPFLPIWFRRRVLLQIISAGFITFSSAAYEGAAPAELSSVCLSTAHALWGASLLRKSTTAIRRRGISLNSKGPLSVKQMKRPTRLFASNWYSSATGFFNLRFFRLFHSSSSSPDV